MIKNIASIVIALLIVGSIIYVIANRPDIDYCTPERIGAYTNVIISHQECEAMSRCIIEPKDIREFHDAQTNFRYCVLEISGEAQRKLEESKEE